MGVPDLLGRHESLFDGTWTAPSDQVPYRAGLVLGSRAAGPAERLLPNDGTRRFVIEVEVASCASQPPTRPIQGGPLVRDDRSGQPVRGGRIDFRQGRVEVSVVVDMQRQNRPEVLGREDLLPRVVR